MSTTSGEIDELKINLTIISKIQKNKKLFTKGEYLNLESEMLVPESVRRWWRGDNRNESINKLNTIINKSIRYMKQNNGLYNFLKSAVKGLDNLKETYSDCTQTKARLDVIIDKINKLELNNKLTSHTLKKFDNQSDDEKSEVNSDFGNSDQM